MTGLSAPKVLAQTQAEMPPMELEMIAMRRRWTCLLVMLCLALSGCADVFLETGGFLTSFGEGLNTIGTCLSPLEPIDLNGVFAAAPLVEWSQGTTEATDAPAAAVEAFFNEQLGEQIEPAYFLSIRLFELGPIAGGEVLQIEPLSDLVSGVYLYDAGYTILPTGIVRDFDGRRRTLQIPILRDLDVAYLRIDLEYPTRRSEPIARLSRFIGLQPTLPTPQTVVLHFGGQDDVTFRNGSIPPTRIGAVEDPRVRRAAVEQFREIYAAFDLTALTDEDTLPAEPYSIIYLGPTDLPWLNYGFAEIVDVGNSYPDDIAIVDTDQIALDALRVLNPEAYGRALGTIAAHEMGHLLGLHHVSDPDALMTGSQCQGTDVDIERMLARRPRKAPITFVSVGLQDWAMADQDAPAYLLQILESYRSQ